MFLVGMLSWWYSNGLVCRFEIIKRRLITSADTFSIFLLARTLFNPFRQISANTGGRSIKDKLQAFEDNLLSRSIGLIVRLFMILFGLIVIFLQSIFGLLTLVTWLILPVVPVIGALLMSIGLVI